MNEASIAIVSTNKQKYSETFIQSHLKHLSNHVLYLFNGYLPRSYSEDKLVTEHSIEVDLIQLLKEKAVKVMLAEYGPSGVEMMDICRQASIPMVVHFHGYDAYRMDVLNSYGKRYPELFQNSSGIIVVSKHMYDQMIKLGCPRSKIHLIPYGVDVGVFSRVGNHPVGDHFVSCGRFVPKKAPQITIRAFHQVTKKYPKALLTMIGDGEELGNCQQLVNDLDLQQHVTFAGALDHLEIAKIFGRSLAFLQHSVTTPEGDSEGTPLAIMEAGAASLPIISTYHAGIPDVVVNSQHGFLVAENDMEAMAEKMSFLIEHPAIAQRMGGALKQKVLDYYNMERYICDIKTLLTQLS